MSVLLNRSCAEDRIVTSIAGRRSTILSVIRGSRRKIGLSLFRCSDSEVFAELAAASARGVKVEAIVTPRVKGKKSKLRKLRSALEETGARVHTYAEPLVKYHAKYIVADDGPAIVGSFNFTRKCFEKTCDALVMTHDRDVVAGLWSLMAADCAHRPLPGEITPRLIIGPERARHQFMALLEQARSSIRLIDPKLSDPSVVQLLKTKRAAGLQIEFFGSKRLGNLKSHGKILLIDDRVVVVGSVALAALSLDFRRELAIIVDETKAVTEVLRLFRTVDAFPTVARVGGWPAVDTPVWSRNGCCVPA